MSRGMKWIAGIALVALMAGVHEAKAASITVTFDDVSLGGPQTGVGSNFESQGFRFSPCHNYGIVSSANMGLWTQQSAFQGYQNSQFFTFQAGNGPGNPEYLGSAPGCTPPRGVVGSSLYIDNGGASFSLQSLYVVLGGFGVRSSRGGSQLILGFEPGGEHFVSFSGPEWENLDWIAFGAGFDAPYMFDQITFATAVSESDTLPMSLLAFAAILLLASNRQHQTRLAPPQVA